MDRLSAMAIFVRVVDAGSFSMAAKLIGVGQPAISKQIGALEAHLGAQLLRRTSRTMVLTEAGRDFYDSAVQIVREIDAAEARIGRGQIAPEGLVRATVTPVFGRLYLVPRLPEFYLAYPGLTVELITTDRLPNFLEEGVDVAIFHGPLSDSNLVAKKIAQSRPVTVASPAYLQSRGEPTSTEQLVDHACVTHAPGWLFASEISSGAVKRVLTSYDPPNIAISAVRPSGRFLANRVRVFIDFVSDVLAEEPTLAM